MDIGSNGGIQVPNLAALQQPQPAEWVQNVILGQSGVKPGGSAMVEIASGQVTVTNFDVAVMAIPPEIHIFVGGTNVDTGRKVMFPYHAILSIQPSQLG